MARCVDSHHEQQGESGQDDPIGNLALRDFDDIRTAFAPAVIVEVLVEQLSMTSRAVHGRTSEKSMNENSEMEESRLERPRHYGCR